jgi:hypothetical protein
LTVEWSLSGKRRTIGRMITRLNHSAILASVAGAGRNGHNSVDIATNASIIRGMNTHTVASLALLAKEAATEQPDLIALLAEKVKAAVASDADPYLLMGTLIEGVTHTLASIPLEKQSDTARAAVGLLLDRLRTERFL